MKISPNSKHSFKRPIAVLRYLRQEILWHKAEYRALPSHLPKWNQEVWLSNGYTHKKHLVLQQDLLSNVEQLPTDVLLLNGTKHAEWVELFQRKHRLDFFLNLHRQDGTIWLECVDDFYPSFGSHGRERFDLFPLSPGKSVAVHINARYWHTLMGFGTDTHYVENYIYLEHLGFFEEAELHENPLVLFRFEPQKEIDLRQLL